MASFTGIDEAAATAILGASVVSYAINGAGHLIGTRGNGSTFDAGDFTGIVTGILNAQVAAAVAAQNIPLKVANATAGTVFAKGNITGAVAFTDAGLTVDTLVNALFTATLTGNITINANDLPTPARPNTQFAFKMTQDGTGGRTLTLVNFKKSQGVLTLTTTANAVDVLMFFYDGVSWNAGLMGVDFK